MQQTVMQNVPQAAAIWLVMLAVAVIAVAALCLPARRAAADPDRSDRDATGWGADGLPWEDAYADEVTVAADRAAATALHGRADWERAQEALDLAWTAFDAADRAVRRSAAAAPYGVPDDPAGTPLELADRERFLHRAATAACRRRELTIHQLNDILAHRDGWDPRLHPVLQEAALLRAVRDRALMAYEEAVVRERQAWHTAEVAAAALRNLREEACAAQLAVGRPTAGQLWWAGQWATAEMVDATVPLPMAAQPEPALELEPEVEPAPVLEPEVESALELEVELEPVLEPEFEPAPVAAGSMPAAVAATMRFPTVPLPIVRLTRPGTPVAVPVQAGAPAAESLRQPLAVAGADRAGR